MKDRIFKVSDSVIGIKIERQDHGSSYFGTQSVVKDIMNCFHCGNQFITTNDSSKNDRHNIVCKCGMNTFTFSKYWYNSLSYIHSSDRDEYIQLLMTEGKIEDAEIIKKNTKNPF